MLKSTSKFEVVELIYKKENSEGGFAIATGYWEGNREKLATACRWYEDDGIGYPQTFGKPQWMLLPADAFHVDDLLKLPEKRTAEILFSQQ
ncbi:MULTISPECIES: hypothetical protein [unclassified Halomonas]|uniref:hypothetical protein n=1 Tax=unclassified Halomonas TaxID=2609666 RepID=UPI0007D9B8E5|nr:MULTISPECIES: hypothetical protein [unclassified Halomonas]MBT2784805.1 hypothetical protein [Halomonas sp. ISL-106]MBT2796499.1 hypothetical protein [Halomonas sp. ISL-104]OAL59745.1 hypothetical protein A6R74_00255 [Halomonas sp. ALS9]